MKIEISQYYNIIILYILLCVLIYTILYNTESNIIFDKDNNKSKTKTILYSAIISFFITGMMGYISVIVDKEDEKNK